MRLKQWGINVEAITLSLKFEDPEGREPGWF